MSNKKVLTIMAPWLLGALAAVVYVVLVEDHTQVDPFSIKRESEGEEDTKVPFLIKKTLEEAKKLAEEAELELRPVSGLPTDNKELWGRVEWQNQEPNTSPQNKYINVWVWCKEPPDAPGP